MFSGHHREGLPGPPDRPDARRDVLPPCSLHSVVANEGQAAGPDEVRLLSSAEAASGDQSLQEE